MFQPCPGLNATEMNSPIKCLYLITTDGGVALQVAGLFLHEPPEHGILLSHAHADHSELICQTDPSIKVYCIKGTSKVMKAGSIFAGPPELARSRWTELETQVPVQIGGFKVTSFNVDHSAFDSMAFLSQAPETFPAFSKSVRLVRDGEGTQLD
jgi:phosphoribosyl 1,2-cyclic phosphodiesterase